MPNDAATAARPPNSARHSTAPCSAAYNPNAPRIGHGCYVLANIKARCRVDDVSGCWEWSLAVNDPGRPNSSVTPRLYVPAGVVGAAPKHIGAARAAWLMSGQPLKAGHLVWRTCCNGLCCNPAHLKAGTHAQAGAWTAAHGYLQQRPHRAAVNIAINLKRAMPAEAVRRIEAALRTGAKQRDIAEAHGCHRAIVSRIARGKHIHQRGRLVRGASVFALGVVAA